MSGLGYRPRRRDRWRPPEGVEREYQALERCCCGKAVYGSEGAGRAALRRLQFMGRDGGRGLHVYRCSLRPSVWHVGHY